jgi:hypothetical protein
MCSKFQKCIAGSVGKTDLTQILATATFRPIYRKNGHESSTYIYGHCPSMHAKKQVCLKQNQCISNIRPKTCDYPVLKDDSQFLGGTLDWWKQVPGTWCLLLRRTVNKWYIKRRYGQEMSEGNGKDLKKPAVPTTLVGNDVIGPVTYANP